MCGGEASVFEDIINIATQAHTLGILSYEKEKGGLTGGGVTMRGVKEITGAAAAEDATKAQREQMEADKERMLMERENAKMQNAADQLSKSRQASAVRTRTSGPSTGPTSMNILGSDERDFLGV